MSVDQFSGTLPKELGELTALAGLFLNSTVQ